MTNNTGLLWSDNFHPNVQGHDVLGHRFANDIAVMPACFVIVIVIKCTAQLGWTENGSWFELISSLHTD